MSARHTSQDTRGASNPSSLSGQWPSSSESRFLTTVKYSTGRGCGEPRARETTKYNDTTNPKAGPKGCRPQHRCVLGKNNKRERASQRREFWSFRPNRHVLCQQRHPTPIAAIPTPLLQPPPLPTPVVYLGACFGVEYCGSKQVAVTDPS